MNLVRPQNAAGPAHRNGMVVAGAALGRGDVVPAVLPEDMRTLDQAEFGAAIDVMNRTDELLRLRIPFLAENAIESRMPAGRVEGLLAMVPLHLHEPLAAIVIVEQRGVEAGGVHIDRIGPRP